MIEIDEDILRQFIVDYLTQHTYITSWNIATDMAREYFGYTQQHPEFSRIKNQFTHKIRRILAKFHKDGMITVYKMNNGRTTYKII